MKKYQLIIIGGGPGGYTAAFRAAELGMSVAIIDDNDLGGVCLNWGCIPTKSLLKNAEVMDIINNACLLYTSPSPRDRQKSRMPSSA